MPRVITTLQAMSHPTVVATINCLSEMADRLREENEELKAALAQPDAFAQGRQEGMKQERALWELSRLGQEIEAQPDHGWTSERIAGMERLKAQQDSRFEPEERPWVGLTDEERASVLDSVPPDNMGGEYYDKEITAIAIAIEAKLKEKNT